MSIPRITGDPPIPVLHAREPDVYPELAELRARIERLEREAAENMSVVFKLAADVSTLAQLVDTIATRGGGERCPTHGCVLQKWHVGACAKATWDYR